ncbi:MAG TPA: PhaM family polyhydroxyalkanoate granule multifunctional regulatory protein [Paraburkholderia sp.]|uniref:PhaM family polyhydroxyalkanoate granule multifunctional regulatory protein n=1 Tax=Paraburkholderia sp. TaxID=1926495 RepID=UPI002CE4AABB|nr:PhaM family polyhydroxyalkanoate granule multifunctional regulatory protein [Paraburkholderia sp.]HTR07231.1 PhaM family polyhydroxyalkanoate granule multifunctional regulatory protein [Paraburkholderia sp.]
MTDPAGSVPPFPGFPGFPSAEMLDRMWGMMRLTPFGGAFPGAEPGSAPGFGPSLSMMSDMMTPLTNIEELDKRITDLRAVEQWLKLNLGMLQSAIQALEVQRATLSTLRAFGAFAQAQMSPSSTETASAGATRERASEPQAASATEAPEGPAAAPPGFDAASWWNLVQAQFNQLAQFAMAQPAAAAQAAQAAAQAVSEAQTQAEAATAKRGSARRSGSSGNNGDSGNHATSGARNAPRGAKKAPAQPE